VITNNSTAHYMSGFPDIRAIDPSFEVDWETLLNPNFWLGHSTLPAFVGVSAADVRNIASEKELQACFAAHQVNDDKNRERIIGQLLDADVNCISHALSALLSLTNKDARRLIPKEIQHVVGEEDIEFDHIGIEIFGKLEWYIELFKQIFAPLEINVVGEHIFPSVQVKSALQYDQKLGDVRIGRIFFSHGKKKVNLEVFEVSQAWQYIALRQAALYAHLREPATRSKRFSALACQFGVVLEPVGHVAYRVPYAETVESIQSVLLKESSKDSAGLMHPYVEQVIYNPSDNSTNTKFVVSTALPTGERINSQLVEVISYDS